MKGKKTKNGNIWRNSGKIKKKNAGKIKKKIRKNSQNLGKIHKIWGKNQKLQQNCSKFRFCLDQIMFFFANVSKWPTPLPPR